jgi:hypothetical protein
LEEPDCKSTCFACVWGRKVIGEQDGKEGSENRAKLYVCVENMDEIREKKAKENSKK